MNIGVSVYTKKQRRQLFSFLILGLLSVMLGASESIQGGQQPVGDKKPVKLKRVETIKVCMVNDAVFQTDQIPVEVDGKTYYGCCEMCKTRLANDEQVRQAIDPVSQKPVDKAKAVIGAQPDSKVFYFESEKTLKEYNARIK